MPSLSREPGRRRHRAQCGKPLCPSARNGSAMFDDCGPFFGGSDWRQRRDQRGLVLPELCNQAGWRVPIEFDEQVIALYVQGQPSGAAGFQETGCGHNATRRRMPTAINSAPISLSPPSPLRLWLSAVWGFGVIVAQSQPSPLSPCLCPETGEKPPLLAFG